MNDPALMTWGIALGFIALAAYTIALHRRNRALRKQLDAVNERLTHMQADVRRYLATISQLGAAPVSPPADLPPPAPEARPAASRAAARVLVADDNPELLTLMQEILQSEGYAVTTARSGTEALELIAAARPDIVVLDVLMPHMNGLELLQKMKEAHLDIPALIVTAYSDVAQPAREFSNVKGILLKPFQVEELLNRVSEIRQHISAA